MIEKGREEMMGKTGEVVKNQDKTRQDKNNRQRLLDVVPLKAPFTMYIDPCGCCNLKCTFCPCNNSDYKFEERHQVMDFSLFEKIADDLAEFDDQVKAIYLFGFGESLLNPRLCKMAKIIKKRNLCRDLRLTTNGTLLNPEYNQALIDSGIDSIRVSVEALSAESFKSVTGVSIDYNRFLFNFRDLYERSRGTNTKLEAKIIATALRQTDIENFIQIYSPVSDSCLIEAQANLWYGFEIKNKTLDGVVTQWLEEDIEDPFRQICALPLINMVVFANGKVSTCAEDWRMENVIGDLHKNSLKEIWEGDELYSIRTKHLAGRRAEIPVCKKCVARTPDNIDEDREVLLEKIRR